MSKKKPVLTNISLRVKINFVLILLGTQKVMMTIHDVRGKLMCRAKLFDVYKHWPESNLRVLRMTIQVNGFRSSDLLLKWEIVYKCLHLNGISFIWCGFWMESGPKGSNHMNRRKKLRSSHFFLLASAVANERKKNWTWMLKWFFFFRIHVVEERAGMSLRHASHL